MEAERDIVAGEMAHLDVDADAVVIAGKVDRRTNESIFLLVSTSGDFDTERVRGTFRSVFPADSTRIDWGGVVDPIDSETTACIRVSGRFDDRDVAIDVFVAGDIFAKLELE